MQVFSDDARAAAYGKNAIHKQAMHYGLMGIS